MAAPHKKPVSFPFGTPALIGLLLGIAGVAYAMTKLGYLYGTALCLLPLVLYTVLYAVKNPYWAYTWVFIINYFVMGIIRYVPGLPAGIVMDCLLAFTLFTLLIRTCYKHVGWERARNGLSLAATVWLVYCLLEVFNTQSESFTAWAGSIRGMAIYFFVVAVLTPIIFYRYRDLQRILTIWSILTLLAVLKSIVQKYHGFDGPELRWLFEEGGYTTHIIRSGVRYFSFFSDAANFGSGMGFSMVVFSITALFCRNGWLRLYFLLVALAAAYGMMISGTRGALAVPFAGYTLGVLLSKNAKVIFFGTVLLIGTFLFLNFTTIGQGNANIRRMRSAFNFQDKSLVVRLENQKLIRAYMKDKPFGAGLGHGGGKAKRYVPDAYLSQIPTDSWFVMVWVETGIVGLALHIAILCYIIAYGSYLVLFRIRDPQLRGTICALVAGVFGMAATSYGNEILGQFPNSLTVYMCQAFIFLAPRFDEELRRAKEKKTVEKHEYRHES